jgi:hypothetical protein
MLLLAETSAQAQVCPGAPDGGTKARLAYLAWAFDREIQNVDTWSFTWGTIYVGAAGAQGAAAGLTTNAATRTDLEVGVIAAAFGAVSLYGLPLKLTLPLRSVRRHWKEGDECAALARAEATLLSVEKDQRLANGPVAHIGNVLVNVGLGLILGLGYGHWTSAGISFGVGVVVGEANAFTQPHQLTDVLAHYRRGQLDNRPLTRAIPPLSWSLVPLKTKEVTGAALQVAW